MFPCVGINQRVVIPSRAMINQPMSCECIINKYATHTTLSPRVLVQWEWLLSIPTVMNLSAPRLFISHVTSHAITALTPPPKTHIPNRRIKIFVDERRKRALRENLRLYARACNQETCRLRAVAVAGQNVARYAARYSLRLRYAAWRHLFWSKKQR